MKQILSEQFLRMSKLAGLLTENELTEISSDLFKRATDISKSRGQDQRTNSMGKTFFNKFLNKELMGGNIINIGYLKPQGGYEDLIITVQTPDALKTRNFIYDVQKDSWDIGFPITRADSRIFSLLAKHINPDTKYGVGGAGFDIIGY
jgi:hypothetical protein